MLANREVYLSRALRVALGPSLLRLFGLHDLGGPLSKGGPRWFLFVGSFYRWFLGSFVVSRGSHGWGTYQVQTNHSVQTMKTSICVIGSTSKGYEGLGNFTI